MVICLITLLFHAMPSKFQEAVQLGGYFFSDSFTLTTSILQKQVLQILHEYIMISF